VARGEHRAAGAVVLDEDPEPPGGAPDVDPAGRRVLVTDGATDPRTSEDLVSRLAEADAEHVVALGAAFAAGDGLDWKGSW